jgi:hypothetical protein
MSSSILRMRLAKVLPDEEFNGGTKQGRWGCAWFLSHRWQQSFDDHLGFLPSDRSRVPPIFGGVLGAPMKAGGDSRPLVP